MATENTNPVTKPIMTVAVMACGTVRCGSVDSSARCRAESRPANIRQGEARPVRNVTPPGHPVLFSKSRHTKDDDALCPSARQVTVIVMKDIMLNTTS